MVVMICGLSVISLMLGSAIACMAKNYPKHRAAVETVAGILLIGGLGSLGNVLEVILGRP
jgi:hypothetical protein